MHLTSSLSTLDLRVEDITVFAPLKKQLLLIAYYLCILALYYAELLYKKVYIPHFKNCAPPLY